MTGRVAIFVDGDNINRCYAGKIRQIAQPFGSLDVMRVYGNISLIARWSEAPDYRLIHAGEGKNAADLLLTVDAMEFALTGDFSTFLIASSDGDFSHIALRLRERGINVVGVGEAKAPARFRSGCSTFTQLGAQTPASPKAPAALKDKQRAALDLQIRETIAANSTNGEGIRIADLASRMYAKFGVRIGTYPERTWRAYLLARNSLYDLDPKGPDAKVRFKKNGFSLNA